MSVASPINQTTKPSMSNRQEPTSPPGAAPVRDQRFACTPLGTTQTITHRRCGNMLMTKRPPHCNPPFFFSIFLAEFPKAKPETCSSCKPLTHHLTCTCQRLHTPPLYITPAAQISLISLSCFSLNLSSSSPIIPMADRPHQLQVHPQRGHGHYEGGIKNQRGGGPSAVKVMAVLAALPVGGTLLALAGLTLAGSVIGLLVTSPLFIIFSPVLVPAAIVVGLAVAGFLSSGALGLTGLSSLSWVLNYLRCASQSLPREMDQAKRRMQDMAAFVGQKTREVGQEIQSRAQEGRRT